MRKKWNKKGWSIGGWFEGILFAFLFVVLLTAVLASFNATYGQDHSMGLNTDNLDDFTTQVDTGQEHVMGGEVETTNVGLTLTSGWALARGIFSLIWDFFNGAWINHIIINIMGMDSVAGYTIALVARALFLGSLIFSIIYLFFKVKV